jgi:hypothetical protein
VFLDEVIKLKLPLSLTKHYAMTGYWGAELHLQAFLTSALHGGTEVSGYLHSPDSFNSRERTIGTYWVGGWVGPSVDLDVVERRSNPTSCRDSNPARSARSLFTILSELLWIFGEWMYVHIFLYCLVVSWVESLRWVETLSKGPHQISEWIIPEVCSESERTNGSNQL